MSDDDSRESPRIDSALIRNARAYLSVRELAQLSGLSELTIRRLLRAGKIPCFQPGGPRCRVLVPADALERLGDSASPENFKNAEPEDGQDSGEKRTSAHHQYRARWRQQLPFRNPLTNTEK
jgi:excisionase family DNA binding protein